MPRGVFKRKLHTEKAKRKISENNARFWLNKKFSEEHIRKIRNAKVGNKNPSFGKGPSKETRKKMRMAHLGRKYKPMSLEGRMNISIAQKSKTFRRKDFKHSEESKRRISEIKKGIKYPNRKRPEPFTEEHRKNISKSHKGDKCHFWKGGISYEPYSVDWNETLKRSIRERDNYMCQLCNQYGNTVHHIDYEKKNSNPTNLITLCHSCHNKTNLNRDYWKRLFRNSSK